MATRGTRRRVRRTADEWRKLIAEQARSGLTQREFCSQHKVGVSTFGKARQRFSGDDTGTTVHVPDFVPVETTAHDAGHWELELEVAQRVVIRLKGL